ncbi:hypothetical protein Y032_0065g3652 [Ancylostoma ceylanicum]|uniref:Uncharacterized protein n=1 Tax=Ancylostoma ceylanicum TaxID=53326 RepID=A0A016U0L5_9BILA|nr:hypothetical protein Y032_0065g3652 [Ancylostoma ceylanicum]
MLTPHPSSRSHRNSVAIESVYFFFDKDCTYSGAIFGRKQYKYIDDSSISVQIICSSLTPLQLLRTKSTTWEYRSFLTLKSLRVLE